MRIKEMSDKFQSLNNEISDISFFNTLSITSAYHYSSFLFTLSIIPFYIDRFIIKKFTINIISWLCHSCFLILFTYASSFCETKRTLTLSFSFNNFTGIFNISEYRISILYCNNIIFFRYTCYIIRFNRLKWFFN